MSQGDWGEEKKGRRPADVLRVSFPGLYPFIFRRTTKATRTREPGEPRDSEDGEEPVEIEIEPREPGKRSERTGNHNVFSNRLLCVTLCIMHYTLIVMTSAVVI